MLLVANSLISVVQFICGVPAVGKAITHRLCSTSHCYIHGCSLQWFSTCRLHDLPLNGREVQFYLIFYLLIFQLIYYLPRLSETQNIQILIMIINDKQLLYHRRSWQSIVVLPRHLSARTEAKKKKTTISRLSASGLIF